MYIFFLKCKIVREYILDGRCQKARYPEINEILTIKKK